MEKKELSTEWALLFPLKTGLLALRSSIPERTKESKLVNKRIIRRGSSLSELDKLQPKLILPDIVRSTERSYEFIPRSPTLLSTEFRISNDHMCSIGDLMNLERFGGSNWSVRSETLVARIVPLSTVTSKPNFPLNRSTKTFSCKVPDFRQVQKFETPSNAILTSAQRTSRLSKLIKKQQDVQVFFPTIINEDFVSKITSY